MDVEKDECIHAEDISAAAGETQHDPDELRKVVRKLDYHLLPLCFVLYTFSVLDRSNLGNARLVGLKDDIDLSGHRYEWLGNTFYIAYIVFQFNTLGWKIFKPHKWVAFVVLYWGLASSLQAAAMNWSGLMACRFFLGWAETMFGPGIPLYFSFFYPREAIGVRFGVFLSGAALANAYGGALAYGLSHIKSNIGSWRFLFIIEGVPTVLLSVVVWFYLPDSPASARFFTPREAQVAQQFANSQPGDYHHEGLQLDQLTDAFKDYKNYLFSLMNFACNISFSSLPLFLPTIISQLGAFSPIASNGLSAPPYLLSFLLIILTARASDHLRLRGPFATFSALLSASGFAVLGATTSPAARYAGIFLAVQIFVTVAVVLVWNVNTNETGSKRAGGLWLVMTLGQCGPLLGTNVFPADEAPYYRRGMWVSCAFALVAAAASAALSLALWRENRRRDRVYGKPADDQGRPTGRADGLTLEERERSVRFII
ncbi:hypothetical protein SLS55_003993 [Diplodia seriata]|uniref:Uncharacterized protein n=1 Tax=Diplodia seriata TaxID=420778 RepID=A0ABR3CI49_9PEZI